MMVFRHRRRRREWVAKLVAHGLRGREIDKPKSPRERISRGRFARFRSIPLLGASREPVSPNFFSQR
jgi:hypothetical protein